MSKFTESPTAINPCAFFVGQQDRPDLETWVVAALDAMTDCVREVEPVEASRKRFLFILAQAGRRIVA